MVAQEETADSSHSIPKMALEVSDPEVAARGPRKGGFRTMPFIIVNEAFEKVASYGLMPNMIFYLINSYHMELSTGTSILFIWGAISNGLAILGAFLSDSFLGRYWVITLGSISSLLGMILLWLTAMIPDLRPPPCVPFSKDCVAATSGQIFVLVLSFAFMSIGAGCIRPCSMAFGADQLVKQVEVKGEKLLQSFFNWYYTSIGVSSIIALTIIVYIQEQLGWAVGFGIPAILMFFSAIMFVLGTSLYIKVKAGKSLLTGLIQVFVATFRKIKMSYSAVNLDFHKGPDSIYTVPSHKLRFFNRACIIMDPAKELKEDGSARKPWKLCTIDQVESLKALLRVLPIWSTGIMSLLSLNQHSYTTLQANVMDRHLSPSFKIPAGSFMVFTILTLSVWVPIYDRFIVPFMAKRTGNPRGLSTKTRMGIGLIFSALSMVVSAIVEKIRRDAAIDQGLVDKPRAVMDMSAMWLIPQFALSGFAEAFNAIAQIDFFYSELPKSMASLAMALFTLGMCAASLIASLLVEIVDGVTKKQGGESWLSHNLNKGHLDYYYWLIALLCFANFGYFLLCCWLYGPTNENKASSSDGKTAAEQQEVSGTGIKTHD